MRKRDIEKEIIKLGYCKGKKCEKKDFPIFLSNGSINFIIDNSIRYNKLRKGKKHTTAGISSPRPATSVHSRIPLSASLNSEMVLVLFFCFCFPWRSKQGTWPYLRSSLWNLTESHEEKKTITFLDRYLFRKEYRSINLLAEGTTQ